MENFDFILREETAKAIADMGYETPTPIQEMTIPPLLDGKDVIGQAQTGTGKTAAFGIPMIERVDASDRSVQGLVLCPTRELAMQTAGEIQKLAKYQPGISVLAVYGGQPIERQLLPLKRGVQVVVGTPGRVLDHLNRGTLTLNSVRFAVLDEADEMLDMGFREDMETILSQTNPERQTALFSATMPFPIMSLAQKYLREPEFLRVENRQLTVEAVKQTYIPIRSFHKAELLSRLLVRDGITRALVFMNTKLGVEEVVTKLQSRGFAAAGLHGDMRQIERDAIMERFKNGSVGILVATDVAARGLDIENVEAVFNYDIPLDVEYYVHRIGRTGRAGKEGRAYTFVVGRETARMWEYRKVTKAAILSELPPSGDDIKAAEEERTLAKARETADGEMDARLTESARKLLETTPAETAVAALLRMLEDAVGEKIDPALDIRIPEPPKPAPRPIIARAPVAPRPGYSRGRNDRAPNMARGKNDAPLRPARAEARDARRNDNRFDRHSPASSNAEAARFDRHSSADAETPRFDRHSSASSNAKAARFDRHSPADAEAPRRENRFERRRREFGELPAAKEDASLAENANKKSEDFKPYRPWDDSPRARKRDGAIDAKDKLPRAGRKPRETKNGGKS